MRRSHPSFFGLVASAILAILLTGCGGGGSSATTAQTATSFPLLSAYKSSVAAGETVNYTISGTCSGSATITDTPSSAATFEGTAALAAADTTTTTSTNCTPASSTTTTIGYYDSNYNLLGESGSEYGTFLTIPPQLAGAVNVGDTASYGTETLYTDSTKKTVSGTTQLSYVIEQDGTSTSTVIADFISKDYDASNQLVETQQSRYRLDASGTLTPLSIDIQYANSNHLLLTAQ